MQPTLQICPNPIFVIGSGRSGTTILGDALGYHSQVCSLGESQILFDLFVDGHDLKNYRREGDSSWLRMHKINEQEFATYLALGFNALFTKISQGKRWLDHTPPNTLLINKIGTMFPGAQYIHILRDGRNVVHSMTNYARVFSSGKLPVWAKDFREACKNWKRHVELATQFCATHPEQCLLVRYEQLVADADGEFHRIFEFLQLPPEEGPARFMLENPGTNSSFPEKKRSFTAHRKAANPWTQWNAEQKQMFVEEAGETMIQLGLATSEELQIESEETASPAVGVNVEADS